MTVALVGIFLFGLTTTSAEPAAVRAPDGSPCLVVGYTVDTSAKIQTMFGNNSTVVGSHGVVITDCGSFEVYLDGLKLGGGIEKMNFEILPGVHTVLVEGEWGSVTWETMNVFSGSEAWFEEVEYGGSEEDGKSSTVWWDELVAHGATVGIIFFMTTTVVYRIASWRVEREIEPII